MKRKLLITYQLVTGLSDTLTGLFLIAAPELTLHMMKLRAPTDALQFISYIGVFVLSVGLACLYGAWLAARVGSADKLEVVWLLTASTRILVAVFIVTKIASGDLETGWATVAFTDGAFAILQFSGLARGWLRNACD